MSERLKVKLGAVFLMATLLATSGYALANTLHGSAPSATGKARAQTVASVDLSSLPPSNPSSAGSSGDTVGPDASGAAAFGLCTAWAAGQGWTFGEKADAVAFRNLATAAGGEIATYCAGVSHPGQGSQGNAPVSTPNNGGPDTADQASGGASEVGTSIANSARP